MSFMKLFHFGYIVFLLALASIYFFVPRDVGWIAIVVSCLLFGAYQMIIGYRVKRKQI